jgi:nitrite reductase/ring-hydroxylating ferredoxin subunit
MSKETRSLILILGLPFALAALLLAAGVFEDLRGASLRGIRRAMGDEVARQVEARGFEHVHEIVSPIDIPRVTDHAYAEAMKIAPSLLKRAVPKLFGTTGGFYFERYPNVRFHIPLDVVKEHKQAYQKFRQKHGEGKITAHGPHRDSWLDCPLNSVNVWVAVGPVETGNGLLIYPASYGVPVVRNGCHIRHDQSPGVPTNVAMEPGDAIVFHGDQLHASVVNHTRHTRHVVSFRLALDRPVFADTHLQTYAYSRLAVGPLATGPLGFLSEVPASVQMTHFRTRARQAKKLLRMVLGGKKDDPGDGNGRVTAPASPDLTASALKPGDIRALDAKTCVARLEDGSLVAFQRLCTHEGADLALGYVDGDRIRCPWHNLPFEAREGVSPCQTLKKLRTFPVSVENDRVVVSQAPAE